MKIIEILKERSEKVRDNVKIELKLYNLADDLERKSRAHLKRIITVLTEFDIHDEKHSEKVIENIENLFGDEKLNSLSTYELFLLHLSAFFHDCAMAPSDWEINAMKLTEGNENYSQNQFSIKHDLKIPFKFSNAHQIIISNKQHLYKSFDGDVKNWMFSPRNEEELINYLSTLLIQYQNYRNGFADQIKKVKNQTEFNELNDFIRTDYIRATHHTRIENYIKNLELIFSNAFEQPAWGKKLAHDLSLICRSHGEDSNFINDFSTNAQYYGSESANLQLVAIMLRLGDIIHFSYDRAPIDLRSSRLFKSEYSFQQWAIKNSGANYSIYKGKIAFRAYCETPEIYFKLHQYIDWIEIEIQNYFKFQRQWGINYIDNFQDKIDRTNIINDDEVFLAKRGLSFSLNQKKILELLMGVGLYKNKFACLRELYQNSLDACRCIISQNEASSITTKATIEFRLEEDEDKIYLCCIDNGIGMTKDTIENYLLKVGNSYYKSSEFYKQQANWGGKFTPTSQFGIGILSCFMIGDKIEITTKTLTEDYVSCSIDGPHENFYYRKTSSLEKENIPVSGTMVKVQLNIENLNTLNNNKLNKLGLLLFGIDNGLPTKFEHYLSYTEHWNNHLFNKINHIVRIIPDKIDVIIGLSDGTRMQIPSKPILIDFENTVLGIEKSDFEFIDYLNNYRRIYPHTHKYSDIKDFVESYKIKISFNNTDYHTTLNLPKKEFVFDDVKILYTIPKIGGNGICIDGIYIDRNNLDGLSHYYSDALILNGILNFAGDLRPQLSVDRTSIIEYPNECEKIAEEISKLLLKEILKATKNHIEKNNFNSEKKEFQLIWEYIFEKIGFADTMFINELSPTEYGNIIWEKLTKSLNQQLSIRDFLAVKEIRIHKFNLSNLDILSKKLIITKLISANRINIDASYVSIEQEVLVKTNLIQNRHSFSEYDMLICADDWNPFDKNYDIVSNLYPLIPKRLFEVLDKYSVKKINHKIKIFHSCSNGLTALFSQSPLLINEKLGLYIEEKGSFGKKKNDIYNFRMKRENIALFELNDRFFVSQKKENYVLMVYISPNELSAEQDLELNKYIKTDINYVKGVKEGWSLLVTSMEKENIIIFPGKASREKLVSLISNDFWETYKDYTFKFTDNTIMKK